MTPLTTFFSCSYIAELVTEEERQQLEDMKFYIPCTWAIRLLGDARSKNVIHSDNAVQQLLEVSYTDSAKTALN